MTVGETIFDATKELQQEIKAAIISADIGDATSANQVLTVGALAAILAKIIANPATQTTLAAILVKLADPATQTTLAAVLAKLPSDPSTQTTSAAILAKLIAAPATEATVALLATEVTLALINAKLEKDSVQGLISISTSHHENHAGKKFTVSRSDTLGIGGTIELRIQAPSTPLEMHLFVAAKSSDKATYSIYEATSKTHVIGNAIVPWNRKRSSGNTSDAEVCHTPAGSGDGTLLQTELLGGKKEIGESRDEEEVILAPDQDYLIRVLSAANSNLATITLVWYEI